MAKRKKIDVPVGMNPAPEIQGSAREELALWMKARIQEIDNENRERIELLRTVGEHPSPIFARIVQRDGALGIPKSLTAKALGLSISALDKFYADDYDMGKISALRSVSANAMRIGASVTDPNASRVAIQILDRRGGEEWRAPAQKMEIDDNRDKPPIIDSSKLTFEERQALRRMLERVAQGGEGEPLTEEEQQPGMDLIE